MLIRKLAIELSILGGSMAFAQSIVHQAVNPNAVTVIRTAFGHISILALPERITRVAAGSDAMQIEWHDNNVFIKPVKTGQPTNLMVWTEHQFSTYELEAPGDVRAMSFVVDETRSPVPQTALSGSAAERKSSSEDVQRMTDSVIGSTLLEATPVVPRGVRPARNCVSVLINAVVRDRNSIYVRFLVTNNGPHPYRILSPNVFTMTPRQNVDLLPSMKDLQIPEQTMNQFESSETAQVIVRGMVLSEKDLAPGTTVEGVLTLQPADIEKPEMYEFVFGNDGKHIIQATAVL